MKSSTIEKIETAPKPEDKTLQMHINTERCELVRLHVKLEKSSQNYAVIKKSIAQRQQKLTMLLEALRSVGGSDQQEESILYIVEQHGAEGILNKFLPLVMSHERYYKWDRDRLVEKKKIKIIKEGSFSRLKIVA